MTGTGTFMRIGGPKVHVALSNTLRSRLRLRLIRDLDSYLFGAFAHRLREVLRKERTLEFVPSNNELQELKQTQDWSWVTAFENSLQLKAVVDDMDKRMREKCSTAGRLTSRGTRFLETWGLRRTRSGMARLWEIQHPKLRWWIIDEDQLINWSVSRIERSCSCSNGSRSRRYWRENC